MELSQLVQELIAKNIPIKGGAIGPGSFIGYYLGGFYNNNLVILYKTDKGFKVEHTDTKKHIMSLNPDKPFNDLVLLNYYCWTIAKENNIDLKPDTNWEPYLVKEGLVVRTEVLIKKRGRFNILNLFR